MLKKQLKSTIKYNNIVLGSIIGIIAPVIGVTLFYFYKDIDKSILDFLIYLKNNSVITHTISICVIPNLLLFFIFIWTKRFQSARGVTLATMIWAFTILILRFV